MPRFPHVTWTVVLAAGLLAHPAAAADTAALLTERAEKVRSATRAMAADRPAEAVTGFRRAADIERELFGPQLDVESPTWTQLAWALVAAGDPKAAVNLAARMKADAAKATGRPDHWRVADTDRLAADVTALSAAGPAAAARWRGCLVRRARAEILEGPGKAAGRLAELTRAVADARAVWGDRHPETARCEVELARAALAAEKPIDADKALDRALPVLAAALGEEHPDHAAALAERGRAGVARGDHKAAAVAFGKASDLYAKVLGPAKFDRVICLRELANAQALAGDTAAAADTLAEAIRALVGAGSSRSSLTASLREQRAIRLTQLGVRLDDRKYWVEAQTELRALADIRKAAGEDTVGYGWALFQLAENHRLLSEFDACHRTLDQAQAILAKVPKPNPLMVEYGLITRAQARFDAADFAATKAAWKEVLAYQKTFREEADPRRADVLESLALAHRSDFEFREAVTVLERALALRRRPAGRQTPVYLETLDMLATTALNAGDQTAARRWVDEAVEHLRGGFEPGIHAWVLIRKGRFHVQVREWLDAEAAFAEAEALLRANKLTDRAEYGTLLIEHAVVAARAGDRDRVPGLLRNGLAVLRTAEGPAAERFLVTLVTAAAELHALEQPDAAAGLLAEYIAAARARPARPYAYCGALQLLGQVETTRGRLDEAVRVLDECLEVTRKQFGPGHVQVAYTLSLKAAVAHRRREYVAARALYREALGLVDDDPGHRFVKLAILRTAGTSAEAGGDRATAVGHFVRAVDLTRRALDEAMSGLSERQQFELTRAARDTLDVYLALSRGGDTDGAYARVLAWKGAVYARQRRVAAVSRHADRLPAFRELERVSAAIAAKTLSRVPPSGATEDAELKALARRREQLERELAADPVLAAELKAIGRPDPVAVRDALPADAALVDLFEYDAPSWAGFFQSGRRLAAFVVRPGRPIVRVELGAAGAVRDDLDGWSPWSARATTPDGRVAAARLRERLWVPLAPYLTGVQTVAVSPDGVTGLLPFAALPGGKAGAILLEEVALVSVPVPQALPELLARRPAPAGGSLLLVGDVDFDAGTAGADPPAGRRLARLKGTAAEADVIRGFWGGADGTLIELRRERATRGAVRDALPRVRYAHLATHGYVGEAVRRGTDGARPGNPFLITVQGYAPAALSAVALTGANRPAVAEGFLTALELPGLDLSGVELVVLSACDTGAGRVEAGEGVLGLQRAFQVAGAKTVVASLWPVDDGATEALMGEFYRNLWVRRLPRAEALRQAQLAFVRGEVRGRGEAVAALTGAAAAVGGPRGVVRPHVPPDPRAPAYWAAFIPAGDWR